eukprot:12463674-Alexandrium_andersonii.AAC.1
MVTFWAEGRSCHPVHPAFQAPARHEHFTARVRNPCPSRGMRAAECARGDFRGFLELLMGVAQGTLLTDPRAVAFSEVDRANTMADFAAARRHILFTARVKLAHWQQLPLELFGLAHTDPASARQRGERCLASYAAAGD